MKRIFKSIFAFLLTFVLITVSISISSFAQESEDVISNADNLQLSSSSPMGSTILSAINYSENFDDDNFVVYSFDDYGPIQKYFGITNRRICK